MKTPLAIGGFAAALIVGIAAGGAAAGSDDPTDAAAPTPTLTTPTIVRLAKPEPRPTPQSCLDALDAAEQITDDSRRFAQAIVVYPSLILKAARAGMTYDATAIREITATVKGVTVKIDGINADVRDHVAAYNTAAAECRGPNA